MKAGLCRFLLCAAIAGSVIGCKEKDTLIPQIKPTDFSQYWYKGKAEISSYALNQSRYGSNHDGKTILVFVTEDFNKSKHVKLEQPELQKADKVTVMKLNTMKEFITGIYKYSLMSSVFTPVDRVEYPHSLKLTASSQEWCGQSFMQANWKGNRFEVQQMSYLESDGDYQKTLARATLEDEIWTTIRVAPHLLPVGDIKMIASSMYLLLNHRENKVYDAKATLVETCYAYTYRVSYPELGRSLEIEFEQYFPYKIIGWKETNGTNDVTTARILNTIMSDYWNRHAPLDEMLRTDLDLEN
jgi:hypothetical protein